MSGIDQDMINTFDFFWHITINRLIVNRREKRRKKLEARDHSSTAKMTNEDIANDVTELKQIMQHVMRYLYESRLQSETPITTPIAGLKAAYESSFRPPKSQSRMAFHMVEVT